MNRARGQRRIILAALLVKNIAISGYPESGLHQARRQKWEIIVFEERRRRPLLSAEYESGFRTKKVSYETHLGPHSFGEWIQYAQRAVCNLESVYHV